MTAEVAIPQDNAPAPWENGGDTGLGLRPEEISIPRLRIVGKDAQFENITTSERYDELECVILGMVRQRSMWPEQVREDVKAPLCRSVDSIVGRPLEDEKIAAKFHFPWKKSNLDRASLLAEDDGQVLINCKECSFKNWNEEEDLPGPCAEQWVLPLYYIDKLGNLSPGILTMQKSSLGPLKKYLGQFEAAKQPAFMFNTKITLTGRERGDVAYAVPSFERLGLTDPGENRAQHYEWYYTFQTLSEKLRTPFKPNANRDADVEQKDVASKLQDNSVPEPKKPAAKPKPEPKDEVLEGEVVEDTTEGEFPFPTDEPEEAATPEPVAETPPAEAAAPAAEEDEDPDLAF